MRKQIHDNPIDHGRARSLSHGTWRRVGAKLACAGACALMAGQLLLPSVALAAEWVNVGGTQYDAGTAAGDEAGTWSWDGANDMKLNGYDGGSIGAKGNLTIDVTGINTVTADAGQSAIAVKNGNLAITGDGTLNATAQNDVITAIGDGNAGGDVTIDGADVNVTATGGAYESIGIHAAAGDIAIKNGADVHVEAKSNADVFAVLAENVPPRHSAIEGAQAEEADYSAKHGGCIMVDNAKLNATAGNAGGMSVALYSFGIKTETYLKIANGADVSLATGSAGKISAGVWIRVQDGASWIRVNRSNLTAQGDAGADELVGANRKDVYGIFSQSGSPSATPRISFFQSNVVASGSTAAVYAVNMGSFRAPYIKLEGGLKIAIPDGGTVRDTVGSGRVIGVPGSSVIQDIRTSDEVARNVVISSGDAAEPEPAPQPEPTPAPTPQPGGGSGTDVPSVTSTQASSTAAAPKPAAQVAAVQKSAGALAATGDNAATAAAALGIAGASVIGAGFVASKRRSR